MRQWDEESHGFSNESVLDEIVQKGSAHGITRVGQLFDNWRELV